MCWKGVCGQVEGHHIGQVLGHFWDPETVTRKWQQVLISPVNWILCLCPDLLCFWAADLDLTYWDICSGRGKKELPQCVCETVCLRGMSPGPVQTQPWGGGCEQAVPVVLVLALWRGYRVLALGLEDFQLQG